MLQKIQKLKKIELHAHLFGSIFPSQLTQWLRENNLHKEADDYKQTQKNWDPKIVFAKAFSYLPKLVNDEQNLDKLCQIVFNNFLQDNVDYLEIRSSPKKFPNSSIKKYLKTIIKNIQKFEDKGITIKYILSFNRGYQPSYYNDIFDIIESIDNWKQYIVGVDFSGNMDKHSFKSYLPLLEQARQKGLKCTVHSPEKSGMQEELQLILDFGPERLGHFLFYENEDLQRVIKQNICVEICPTSNKIMLNKEEYHFKDLVDKGLQNISICTDDFIITNKTLSEEICLFAENVNFDYEKIQNLLQNARKFKFS